MKKIYYFVAILLLVASCEKDVFTSTEYEKTTERVVKMYSIRDGKFVYTGCRVEPANIPFITDVKSTNGSHYQGYLYAGNNYSQIMDIDSNSLYNLSVVLVNQGDYHGLLTISCSYLDCAVSGYFPDDYYNFEIENTSYASGICFITYFPTNTGQCLYDLTKSAQF